MKSSIKENPGTKDTKARNIPMPTRLTVYGKFHRFASTNTREEMVRSDMNESALRRKLSIEENKKNNKSEHYSFYLKEARNN